MRHGISLPHHLCSVRASGQSFGKAIALSLALVAPQFLFAQENVRTESAPPTNAVRLGIGAATSWAPAVPGVGKASLPPIPAVPLLELGFVGHGFFDRVTVSTLEGITLQISKNDYLDLSASLAPSFPIKEKDVAALKGLGDRPWAMNGVASATFDLAFVEAGQRLVSDLPFETRSDGVSDGLGLALVSFGGVRARLGETTGVKLLGTAIWANADRLNRLYGTTSLQSERSGLAVKVLDAGWESAGLSLLVNARVTQHTRLDTVFEWNALQDEVAKSPFVKKNDGETSWSAKLKVTHDLFF